MDDPGTADASRADGKLAAAVSALGRLGLGIEGVHVAQADRPAIERRWFPDVRRDIFSASKTFTSIAVGMAEAERLLDVEDPVLDHLGTAVTAPAPGVEAITIRQLLTMTSGISYRWNDPDADHPGDPVADILATPLGLAPGTGFAYRGANTYLLSRVINACSGDDLRDFLLPRLFAPLGINNPQWLRCPLGYSLGAVGLQLRTEELSRLGRTLLDGGRFEGRQLIPADYVASMTGDQVPTDGHLSTGASEPHPDNAGWRGAAVCRLSAAPRHDVHLLGIDPAGRGGPWGGDPLLPRRGFGVVQRVGGLPLPH